MNVFKYSTQRNVMIARDFPQTRNGLHSSLNPYKSHFYDVSNTTLHLHLAAITIIIFTPTKR